MVKRKNKLTSFLTWIMICVLIIIAFNQIYFNYKLFNASYYISRADGDVDIYEFYRNNLSKQKYIDALEKSLDLNDLHSNSCIMEQISKQKFCELIPTLQKKYNEMKTYRSDTTWEAKLNRNHYRKNSNIKPFVRDLLDTINKLKKECEGRAPVVRSLSGARLRTCICTNLQICVF